MPKKILTAVLALFLFALLAPKNNNSHSNVLQNIRITNVHEAALPAAVITSRLQGGETGAINNGGEIYYPVVKVIDGDTVAIEMDGKSVTLRLIGLDTPETVNPRKPVQCFGEEASNKAKEILNGQSVRLEMDPTQGELDKYGRTLAYVFLQDGTNFNEFMIKEGYGHEYTYNLPYKYQREFQAAEKSARENQEGLWAPKACHGQDSQMNPPPLKLQEGAAQRVAEENASGKTYDCSRNTYNCSSFTTQAEAQYVFELCGLPAATSTAQAGGDSNDVHKLDRDGDGKVCESLP